MALDLLTLTALLCATQPAEDVPVQRPTERAAEDVPVEPEQEALAQADAAVPADAEAPAPEAAVPPPVLPPAQPEPAPAVEPSPAPVSTQAPMMVDTVASPPMDLEVAPALERNTEMVRVKRPLQTGNGMLGTAAALWGFNVMFQTTDRLVCGGCATGIFEHAVAGTAIGLAAGGGLRKGGTLAFDDAATQRKRRNHRRGKALGLGLLLGGAAVTLANDIMVYRCMANGQGPYEPWNAATPCNHGINRLVFDVGTGSMGAGAALLAGSVRYGKHSDAYARARRISVAPSVGRDRAGIQIGGRF
ncbi:MAG: hypothetical protein AAGA54_07280 [Myxococcota bacterium]